MREHFSRAGESMHNLDTIFDWSTALCCSIDKKYATLSRLSLSKQACIVLYSGKQLLGCHVVCTPGFSNVRSRCGL